MTPQERQLIDDLFDRLARLENTPRDTEAMSAIMQGLRKAPNARLRAGANHVGAGRGAEARRQPHPGTGSGDARQQNQPAGFLDSMRDAIFGQSQQQAKASRKVRCPTFARPRSAAAVRRGTAARFCSRANRPDNTVSRPTASLLRRAAAAAAVAVRRRWRLVSRHRGGGRGRRGRWLDAARQPPLDDGRRQQPAELRRHCRPSAAALKTAGRGAISPAAIWRATPGSTTSARRSGQRADNNDSGSRAGILRSGLERRR